MYSMDDCCQRRNNDTKGCQRLSRVRAINKAQSGWDRNVGTRRMSKLERLPLGSDLIYEDRGTQREIIARERRLTA